MCRGAHPFIPFAGTAKLQLIVLSDRQRTENVVWFAKSATWSPSDLISLVSNVIGNWVTTVGAVVTNNAQLVRVIADDMSTQAGNHYEVTPSPALAGTDTNTPLPNNVSFKLRFGTGQRGKSYRGGIYHVGMTDKGVTMSEISSTQATAIQNAWSNLLNGLGLATGSNLVVASECHNNVWRTVGVTTKVLSIDFADLTLDSQRRRLPGRGT